MIRLLTFASVSALKCYPLIHTLRMSIAFPYQLSVLKVTHTLGLPTMDMNDDVLGGIHDQEFLQTMVYQICAIQTLKP